jgi:flagellar hook-basal body complex protein FliE
MSFIPAVGIVPPVMPTPVSAPISSPVTATGGASATSGAGFTDALSSMVDNLGALQSKADTLGIQAATGTLANPHDYILAANAASLSTQMTVAVRNKALEAFNEIMRMPL